MVKLKTIDFIRKAGRKKTKHLPIECLQGDYNYLQCCCDEQHRIAEKGQLAGGRPTGHVTQDLGLDDQQIAYV